MSLEFGDSAEALLHLALAGTDQAVTWPIGLDGVIGLSREPPA